VGDGVVIGICVDVVVDDNDDDDDDVVVGTAVVYVDVDDVAAFCICVVRCVAGVDVILV